MIDFDDWCYHAVAQIRFKPDRQAVFEELKAHLEDHYDDLISHGCAPEKAKRLAMEAMGDPEEIAPQLGAIHKPWLGYIYRAVKRITIVLCIWAIFLFVAHFGSHIHALISTAAYDSLREAGEGGFYSQPNVADSSDGYRFKITEAAVNAAGDTLYLELQSVRLFWLQEPAVLNHFYAVDSLGNHYASRFQAQYEDVPRVSWSGGFYSQFFTSDHLEISHYDKSAEWIELRYDRDGRDIRLRIDLTGGKEG